MPKAILKFNLPEEQFEYDTVVKAPRMRSFLWDFNQQLLSWRKYHNDFTDASDALDKIREEFFRLLNEHNVELD